MSKRKKPTLAVWKFTSCDGCQLSLLDCEDALLQLAEQIEIAYFMEATKKKLAGPYDLSLVEGSISTEAEIARIRMVREQSRYLVTIGACATQGGIQALKNFQPIDSYLKLVYPKPEYIATLGTSVGIAEYIKVDFELRGCPINKYQLLEVCQSFLLNKKPNIPSVSVCTECKAKGNTCILVAQGTPCLGPVTHAGCGALCPSYNRGCYGCFGPKETAAPKPLMQWLEKKQSLTKRQSLHLLRNFNANAQPFLDVSKEYE